MSQLQNALDAMDASAANGNESQLVILAKCRALLRGYHERWVDAGYKALAVETTVTAGLRNPTTGASSRTFTLAGKLDVIAESPTGERIIIDHKTTTADIAPGSVYWSQLAVESQPSHYMLLEWQNGRKVDAALWDAVRKPTIGVASVPVLDADGLKIVLDANGQRVLNASTKAKKSCETCKGDGLTDAGKDCPCTLGKPRQTADTAAGYVLQTRPMTPAEVETRIYEDIQTRPDWYFQRQPVPRLDAEIMEHAEEVWGHAQDLIAARRAQRWPRNSGACLLYGSACKFLPLCSGHDTPESDRWVRKENVHAELPTSGDGRDTLTNSRLKCFQTCRRKHFYQYELGIERYDEEEREALYFGSLLHVGLEHWFRHLIKE